MHNQTIKVVAEWDDEAGVWVATSDDICGLAIEADTVEALKDKLPGALCDLLEMNGPARRPGQECAIDFHARASVKLPAVA